MGMFGRVGNNLVNFLYEGSLINVELPLDNSDDEVGKHSLP